MIRLNVSIRFALRAAGFPAVTLSLLPDHFGILFSSSGQVAWEA
jgi:hypothetical protein